MSCRPLRLAVAAFLLLSPAATWAADGGALPDGSGAAFHQRMMDWSTAKPAGTAQTIPSAQLTLPPPEHAARRQQLPYLSSRFGLRSDPLGKGERMHGGIDIPGALGSPILAADSGTVTFAGPDGGYGLMIELDHGNGLRTRYGHLSRISVGVGEQVQREQAIGRMGSTGRSTGSHLHFEVLSHGRKVDPLGFLGEPQHSATFVPKPTAPFIAQTAPVHISRFAQARAARSPASGDERCPRQEDRPEDGCPG